MILPQTFVAALFLLVLGMICLGSWASAYKLYEKLRFELFYVDFAIGAVVLTIFYALTVGSLGFDGFSFMDDLSNSGKRQWFYALLAGIIFNFGNMLLMSAVSVAGMAVAFPAAFGIALIVSTVINMFGGPTGNTALLLTGCGLLLLAVAADAITYNMLGILRHEVLARAGKTKSTRRQASPKGVILGLVAGLFLGSYLPMIDQARTPEIGLGPYSLALLFAVGLFFSTLVFSIFFINLPVEGDPVEITDYIKAGLKAHSKGILAGALWSTGALAIWVVATTPNLLQNRQALAYLLTNGAPILAALLGLLVWKEFRDGDMRVRIMTVLMLLLFAGGLTLLSLAPMHIPKPT
jgi:glucose uptake protein